MRSPPSVPGAGVPRRRSDNVRRQDRRRVELDAGGVWRFIHRGPDGSEYVFRGVYHEVAPPERIVRTFEFEGMPGHVSLETATFDEQGGKTTVVGKSVFQTVADRDGQLASGMEKGLAESMDRLADLLRELQGVPTWLDAMIVRLAGQSFIGPQAVLNGVFARIGQDFDGFTADVGRLVGDTVLSEGRYRRTVKATGKRLDVQVAHVWDVRDGKIVRFQQYVDTWQVAQATGVTPKS